MAVEQEYITGVVNRSERLLILLDLDHIIP